MEEDRIKKLIILFALAALVGRVPTWGEWWNEDIFSWNIPQYLSADAQVGVPFFVALEDGERPLKMYVSPVLTTLSVGGGVHFLFRPHSDTLDSVALGFSVRMSILPVALFAGDVPDLWSRLWYDRRVYLRFRLGTFDISPSVGFSDIVVGDNQIVAGLLLAFGGFGIEYNIFWRQGNIDLAFYPGAVDLDKPGRAVHRVSVGWHKR